jgi:outer membrane protein TolC
MNVSHATYRIQRAELFPSIAATGLEQVKKYPPAVAGIAAAASGSVAGNGTFRYFDAGIGFTSYEIDLFGRLRSLNHQRLQQYFGASSRRKCRRTSPSCSMSRRS